MSDRTEEGIYYLYKIEYRLQSCLYHNFAMYLQQKTKTSITLKNNRNQACWDRHRHGRINLFFAVSLFLLSDTAAVPMSCRRPIHLSLSPLMLLHRSVAIATLLSLPCALQFSQCPLIRLFMHYYYLLLTIVRRPSLTDMSWPESSQFQSTMYTSSSRVHDNWLGKLVGRSVVDAIAGTSCVSIYLTLPS